MKTFQFNNLIAILSFLFLSLGVFAQEVENHSNSKFVDGQTYVITRQDGVEYIGEILQDDAHELLIETDALGKLYLPKYEIKSIVVLKGKKTLMFDEYQPEGPFTTRYAFTTNALPIKKGENYGMINLYGPEAHVAVTDKLNIGLMSTWIASPMVLSAKYSFNSKESNVNLSFGTLVGTSGYFNAFKGYGGLHYFNVTFGNRRNNLTFSGGYAYLQTGIKQMAPGVYTDSEFYDYQDQHESLMSLTHGPIVSVAGIFKIGAKSSFIFDSMIGYFTYETRNESSEYDSSQDVWTHTVASNKNAQSVALFLMPGVRFQSTDRRAFQICVAGVSTFGDSEVSFPIPMISWFYKF